MHHAHVGDAATMAITPIRHTPVVCVALIVKDVAILERHVLATMINAPAKYVGGSADCVAVHSEVR